MTVTNPTGFAKGQYVLLDEDDWTTATFVPMPPGNPVPLTVKRTDRLVWAIHEAVPEWRLSDALCPGYFSRYGRSLAEIKEISSVSGNTITFTTPIHITYPTAKLAQLVRYTGGPMFILAGSALEDLSAIGGTNGKSGSAAR